MAKNYEWKVLYEPLIIPSVIRSLSNIWLLYVTVVRSAIIQGPFFQRKASILDLLSALFHEATEVLKSLSSWKNPLVCHAMQQVRSIKLKRKKCLRTSRQKENNYFSFSTRICHFNIHAWLSLSLGNNPFYSCVVSCQAFQQRWGEGGPSYDTNLAAFQM